jgi:selenocysteine lyase/cysteine desulfurase
MKQNYGIKTARRAEYLRKQETEQALAQARAKVEKFRNASRIAQVEQATK